MARRSRGSGRSNTNKSSLVVSGTKLSRTRSRSRSRSRGARAPPSSRNGSVVSTGMFRPTRNFQKDTSGTILNPRFPARGARRRGAVSVGGSGLPHLVATYVDPFSEDAGGCRYPDVFQGLTDTFTTNYVGSIQTAPSSGGSYSDANMNGVTPSQGTSLFLLTPDPSNLIIQGVCGTNANGTSASVPNLFFWPNGIVYTGAAGSLNAFGPGAGVPNTDNTISNIIPFRTNYSAARLVSGGVKLFSTTNFSTVSGTIHVAPVFVNLARMTSNSGAQLGGGAVNVALGEMYNGWQLALPYNLQGMSNLPGYAQYPMSSLEEDEIAAIYKRAGEEALLFKPTQTAWGMDDNDALNLSTRYGSANIPDSYGHYCILVYVDGVQTSTGEAAAPGTTILEMEIRNHYECQFNNTSTTLLPSGGYLRDMGTPDAKKAAPHQPVLMAAANNLASDIPAVRCVDASGQEETSFMGAVSSAWKSAKTIASSLDGAVDVAGAVLSALVL